MLSQQMQLPNLAAQDDCLGCMACVDICKTHAISPLSGQDGHLYVKIDPDKCVHCRACEKLCSNVRSQYGENTLSKSEIYAGWACRDDFRAKATSGGIFAALAQAVIDDGGVVVGAYLDGTTCYQRLIHTREEIFDLQGSKYVSSTMTGIYQQIAQELENKTVLFSGVGCQCAAVLAYFANHKKKDNLITVDLVCGGFPSRILVDKFLEQNQDITAIRSFRTKARYELKVCDSSREYVYSKKSLPLHGFNCGMTNRYNCYHCQFACAHRRTDITIGDLWNDSVMKGEHEKGISMIIVHSPRGKQWLQRAQITYQGISWEDALIKNRRTVCGKQHMFMPRKYLVYAAEKMPYSDFVKLYCIDMKPRDIFLFLFRIYRYLVMRLKARRDKKTILRLVHNSKG